MFTANPAIASRRKSPAMTGRIMPSVGTREAGSSMVFERELTVKAEWGDCLISLALAPENSEHAHMAEPCGCTLSLEALVKVEPREKDANAIRSNGGFRCN